MLCGGKKSEIISKENCGFGGLSFTFMLVVSLLFNGCHEAISKDVSSKNNNKNDHEELSHSDQ